MSSQIDHLLNETRRFAPSAEFAANAVGDASLYERAAADQVVHAEIFYDPQTHTARGVPMETVIKGLQIGRAHV